MFYVGPLMCLPTGVFVISASRLSCIAPATSGSSPSATCCRGQLSWWQSPTAGFWRPWPAPCTPSSSDTCSFLMWLLSSHFGSCYTSLFTMGPSARCRCTPGLCLSQPLFILILTMSAGFWQPGPGGPPAASVERPPEAGPHPEMKGLSCWAHAGLAGMLLSDVLQR